MRLTGSFANGVFVDLVVAKEPERDEVGSPWLVRTVLM